MPAADAIPEGLRRALALDLPPLLAVAFAAVALGVLGNFLVLRRQAMLGDAIAHAVLPGLVGAFLVTGSRAAAPMLFGALVAGLVTVLLIGAVTRFGRVERGAALGVVFTAMFALGVVLIESRGARSVDLDADCVLNGQLELLFWSPPETWGGLLRPSTLAALPHQVLVLAGVAAVACAFVAATWTRLRLVTFDPAFGAVVGARPGLLGALLLGLVAAAVVASFEALGSILVVALLVCPAATARLVTERLGAQVRCSVALAVATSLGGYLVATALPATLGLPAIDAAGTIAALSGAIFVATAAATGRRRRDPSPA